MIFGVLRNFPVLVDFSWVVLFVSVVFFSLPFQCLRKKLNTTAIGNEHDTSPPLPLFLILCKSERGTKWITLQEDDVSIQTLWIVAWGGMSTLN